MMSLLNTPAIRKLRRRVGRWVDVTLGRRQRVVQPVSDAQLRSLELTSRQQIDRVRAMLARRGVGLRSGARPRVFLAIRHVNWERQGLIEPWHELADVVEMNWPQPADPSRWSTQQKDAFNGDLLRQVQAAHVQQPIDLFFGYLSGASTRRQTIDAVRALGIVTANISLDDTLRFWARRDGDGYQGTAELASCFDVSITTQNPGDVAKYVWLEAPAVFMPPAGNPRAFAPVDAPVQWDVSFIGQNYGQRAEMIDRLRREGIAVQTFGRGWPAGPVDAKEMNRIYASSLINLGFGYILDYDNRLGLKGRDFEVPLSGRLYLTTFHEPLARCFNVGREIACYRDENDLVRMVRHFIANRDEALTIGAAGRARCLADHTWAQRFGCLIDILSPAVPVEDCAAQLHRFFAEPDQLPSDSR